MSSKYGFETSDDKKKQEQLQNQLKQRESELEGQREKEIANRIGPIVLDILSDFAIAQDWERGVNSYNDRTWVLGTPPRSRDELKNDNPLHVLLRDNFLEVHFTWYRFFTPDSSDRKKLCEVLRDMTQLPVKLYYAGADSFSKPVEIFR